MCGILKHTSVKEDIDECCNLTTYEKSSSLPKLLVDHSNIEPASYNISQLQQGINPIPILRAISHLTSELEGCQLYLTFDFC